MRQEKRRRPRVTSNSEVNYGQDTTPLHPNGDKLERQKKIIEKNQPSAVVKRLQIAPERDVLVGVSFGVLVEMLSHFFLTRHTITSYKNEISSNPRRKSPRKHVKLNQERVGTHNNREGAKKKTFSQLSSTRAAGRPSPLAKCQRKKRVLRMNSLGSTLINRR